MTKVHGFQPAKVTAANVPSLAGRVPHFNEKPCVKCGASKSSFVHLMNAAYKPRMSEAAAAAMPPLEM